MVFGRVHSTTACQTAVVEWMLGNHAMVAFQPEGPVVEEEVSRILSFDAMSNIENQEVRISLNGAMIYKVTLEPPSVWQTVVTEPFRLKRGENHLNIDCTMSRPNAFDPRDMALLMSEIVFREP